MATGNVNILLEFGHRHGPRQRGDRAVEHAKAAYERANAADARGDVELARFWARVAQRWERVAVRCFLASITIGALEASGSPARDARQEVAHAR